MAYTRPSRYPDGSLIPTSLPDAYQPSDMPMVPAGENCGNCRYYASGYCDLFDAPVRNYYWCKKWVGAK